MDVGTLRKEFEEIVKRSREVDLVGDFGGQQLFVIEGDSLVDKCLADENLSFFADGECFGFQLLHAVWIVERFLCSLLERGCNFHIVFFESHRHVTEWTFPKARRLAREIIALHLTKFTGVNLRRIASPDAKEWTDYLSNEQPYFVMASAQTTALRSDSALESSSENEAMRVGGISLKRFILDCLNRGINIALLSDTKFLAQRVTTFVMEAFLISILSDGGAVHQYMENHGTRAEHVAGPPDLKDSARSILLQNCRDYKNDSGRAHLSVMALSCMIIESAIESESSLKKSLCFAAMMLLHVAALENLSLFERASLTLDVSVADLKQLIPFELLFLSYCGHAYNLLEMTSWEDFDSSNLCDFCDGRVLLNIGQLIVSSELRQVEAIMLQTNQMWMALDMCTNGLVNQTFEEALKPLKSLKRMSVGQSTTPSNSIVIDHAAGALVIRPWSTILHQETHHWHVLRLLTDDFKRASVLRGYWELRGEQAFALHMHRHAESLLGTKTFEKVSITANQIIAPVASKPAGIIGSKKKAMIIAEQLKKSDKDLHNKSIERWKALLNEFSASYPLGNGQKSALFATKRRIELGKLVDRVSAGTGVHPAVKLEIEFYRLMVLLEIFSVISTGLKDLDPSDVPRLRDSIIHLNCKDEVGVISDIIACIQQICEMGDLLLPAYVPYLKRAVKFIGFKSSLIPEHIRDRKEKADPSENAKGKRFSFGKFSIPDGNYPPPPCGVSHVEFQLMFMGSLLSRDVDSKPDPRVRGFFPDAWQRKVLDVIDRRESMLVCAPTSSGKTFIAYYAAEQVLRSSDDHVLVYVAPTKALVNQVIADLTARFSKQYKHSGKTMVGLYTRDYKFRAMSSQILVTVPQMLEILLLSPEHSQQWAPRIDWIVFDEIHCMGEMSQGPVWEHLMMISARIPIVALSATIGNTDKFHKWLSLMKAQSGKPLHLIQHHSRYNDLRTFTYTPNFRKAVDSEFKSSPSPFSHIHPIAALSVVSSSALAMIPPDLSLEPMDCFTLFHAISSLDPENDELNQLEPNSFFKNITPTSPPFLRRADVRLWERELMRIMEQWASIDGGPKNAGSRMERLVDLLQRDTKTKITTMEAEWKESELSHSEQPKNRSSPYGSAFNEKCVYDLVTDLRREGMAPALMFMYDRTGCDKLAIKLLSKLEDEEREYKTTAEYRIKLEDYEQHMADVKRAMEAFEKEQQSKRKVKVARTDEDAGPSVIQSPTLPQLPKHLDGFNPNRPDPRFTFADYRSSQYEVVQKEIDAMIYKMKRNAALNPVDLTLLRALARGIGVHHAGKNRKFRQLVEILFRQQYLTVVFATGTLSLGINMPCRTVVHVGDSVFLTALNYRQTSGRAGRRGFDNLGNVVFFGIPLQKAHRLMSSSLPELRGGFPLTVSFVSRLVQLVKASQSGCHASPVLENLLGMSSEDKSQNLGTHASRNVRSALLYLQRSGLISSNEMPVGLCGLANHLFYTEPANIAFAALFNAGVFVGLARRFREDEPSSSANTSVLLEVMEILGHLFDRINLPKSFGASRNWVRRTRTSKIILPPLPEECQRILTEHNQLVLNTYVDFWLNEIASSDGEPENDLPLSHISIPLYHSTTIAPPPFVLRSPFVALSGYADDQYRSINELIQTSRSDVRIDPEAIPSMSPFLESSCTVNAYIVDFFRHGQLQPLTEENGIRTGDVWERLNDFFLILKTIRCSLQILMLRGSSKHEDFVPDEDRNSGGAGEDVDGDSTLVQNSEGSERLTDREDDESEVDKEILPPLRSRPQVADELWHVYSLFLELERRFGQKFKAVWA